MFVAGVSRDNRGVSELLGYVLAAGLFFMVTAASLGVGFTVFENAQDSSQRTQIQHNSQVLAHTIEEVDRLVRASSSSERIAREVNLPKQVAGTGYTVRVVDSGGDSYLLFETERNSESNRVPLRVSVNIADTTFDGGPAIVVRESGSSQIEVRRNDG